MGFTIATTVVRRTSGEVSDTEPVVTFDKSGMMSLNRVAAKALGIAYEADTKKHPGSIVRAWDSATIDNPDGKTADAVLIANGAKFDGVALPITWVSPNSCRSTARQFGELTGMLGLTRKLKASVELMDLGHGEQPVLRVSLTGQKRDFTIPAKPAPKTEKPASQILTPSVR